MGNGEFEFPRDDLIGALHEVKGSGSVGPSLYLFDGFLALACCDVFLNPSVTWVFRRHFQFS